VFVPEDHHKSSPKRTKKKTQKLKFETLLAVICLQCGKNKSQVREIGGGGKKSLKEWTKNGRRIPICTYMASKAVSFVLQRKDILLAKTGQFLARSCMQVMSEFAKLGSSQVGRQVAGKLEIL
jgi:hypothetical protein